MTRFVLLISTIFFATVLKASPESMAHLEFSCINKGLSVDLFDSKNQQIKSLFFDQMDESSCRHGKDSLSNFKSVIVDQSIIFAACNSSGKETRYYEIDINNLGDFSVVSSRAASNQECLDRMDRFNRLLNYSVKYSASSQSTRGSVTNINGGQSGITVFGHLNIIEATVESNHYTWTAKHVSKVRDEQAKFVIMNGFTSEKDADDVADQLNQFMHTIPTEPASIEFAVCANWQKEEYLFWKSKLSIDDRETENIDQSKGFTRSGCLEKLEQYYGSHDTLLSPIK